MKSKAIAAVVALAALALTACSSPGASKPTAGSDDPFDVLYVGGITGPYASLVVTEIQGLNIAIDQINADGGILGRKVVLETLDSKGDPTEAVSVLQKRLSSGDKPDLVRAGLSSTEALAMMPVVTRAGIASYSNSNTPLLDDPKAYPYNKQISAKNVRQVQLASTYVISKGYKKLSVLAAEDASGDGMVSSAQEIYKGTGVDLQVFRYNPADVDLSVAYQRAVADKPDAVYSDCLGAPCVRLIAARTSVVGGTDIPMIGGVSMAGAAGGPAASNTAEAIENLHIVLFDVHLKRPASEQTPEFKAFYKALLKDGTPTAMSTPSVTFDGMKMYAAAAEKAQSTDPAKLIKAINDMKWKPGAFVTYGAAAVDYTPDSSYPTLPDNAFAVVQAGPLVGGQYEPLDLFEPKVTKK